MTRSVDVDRLQSWITGQRWFASKDGVSQIVVVDVVPLCDEPPLALALIGTRSDDDISALYQVLIGTSAAEASAETFDALDDPASRSALVELLLAGRPVVAGRSTIDFRWEPVAGEPMLAPTARQMGAEQSNSSVLIDDRVVLKLFRRLEPGINPELEMLRFLDDHGFRDAPRLDGSISLRGEHLDATLAVAQRFVADGSDGWELTLDALEQGDADTGGLRALGATIGSLHLVLGSEASDSAFAPEVPTSDWLRILAAGIGRHVEKLFASLPATPEVEPLSDRGAAVHALLAALSSGPSEGLLIRTHGDLHLGQVLRTPERWVVLDFEGEPARSMADRRRKHSPLRDVAGMLRSFAYATAAVRLQRGQPAPPRWEDQARRSFLDGYMSTVDPDLLPTDRSSVEQLLTLYELEKTVYELDYEIHHRPDWAAIPAAGLGRLLVDHRA